MADFDAQKARTKHSLPIWVDAFIRDTMTLSAEEIGCYHLILYAMWTRKDCDLLDNDRQLAVICRVGLTTWKRKIKPVLWDFFTVEDGRVISKKLREQAEFVEKFLNRQSKRGAGNKSDKPLKNNKPDKAADITTEEPPTYPRTNQSKRSKSTYDDKDKSSSSYRSADADFSEYDFDELLRSCRIDPFGHVPIEWSQNGIGWAATWVERGLTPKQIIDAAKAHTDKHDSQTFSPSGLDKAMDRELAKPKPKSKEEQDDAKFKYLSGIAKRMIQQGQSWTVGGRYVSDDEIAQINALGLMPEGVAT